ncbi:uncharacterized protein Mgat3 [Eurosta solidaginis]|uniref:uncharacterized protein Mgat3 n=1 Tax=Eurosta solidaginis TaxID=178769 RepID=UPI0035309151
MPEYITITTASGGGGKTTTITKKLVLTLLVLVQICFISCLWLLQLGGGLNSNVNEVTVLSENSRSKAANSKDFTKEPYSMTLHSVRGVNFITKATTAVLTEQMNGQEVLNHVVMNSTRNSRSNQSRIVSGNFKKDFYLKTYRLNKTTIELGNGNISNSDILWCFREGSIDEASQLTNDETAQNNAISWEEDDKVDDQCKCRAGWHGRDCGQPEVMWRALLTAKSRFQLQQPNKSTNIKILIWLIEGIFLNLDLLDLQISMLKDIVDYFVIFIRSTADKDTAHWLKQTLSSKRYLIYHCERKRMSTENTNCSTAQAYAHFRRHLQENPYIFRHTLQPSDLLLYTNDCVLPSPQALRFMKYYATDVRNVPFRLKYVVYGFYWQHPNQTQLNGLISSFAHVDNALSHIAAATLTAEASQTPPFVIGDLNHFGGWYCKYCQQPEDIIAELHAESSSKREVKFPDAVRGRNIDVTYLQKLIANGIYVDGKTQLQRNRRYSDQYYAPAIAEAGRAKYGNLLVNLYESFDDDIEYEDGHY